MRPLTYGLSFLGILLIINLVRYQQEDIIDQVFALDSIDQQDRFKPNVTFEGLIFLQQLLVCLVTYLFSYGMENYCQTGNPYEKVITVRADMQLGELYESVETTQTERDKNTRNRSHNHKNKDFSRSQLQYPQTNTQISQYLSKSRIPIEYSIVLGVLYFISLKSFAQVQTKLNITMSVGFKALNLVIFFFTYSYLKQSQFRIPFTKIHLTFGKGVMTGFYGFVLALMVAGISMVYFAIDDLFRIAMIDSNKSLGLVFYAWPVAIYVVSLGLDHVILAIFYTIKEKYRGVGLTHVILTLLQFSCVCFGINLIYDGTLTSTLELVYKYPGSLWVLAQLCVAGFFQYIVLAFTLMNYPMVVLATVIGSRPCLKYIQKHLVDEPSVLGAFYGVIAVGTLLYVVELVRLYDEIHGKRERKQLRAMVNMTEGKSIRPVEEEGFVD